MVCLVTGSSRGLGKAVALALGKKGHQVVVHCRDREDEAAQTASLIEKAMILRADVRSAPEVKTLV
ncbi:MAG: SDR family NAD(P)-dependent oxidoreductase, partial [Nitrospirota bacterium]